MAAGRTWGMSALTAWLRRLLARSRGSGGGTAGERRGGGEKQDAAGALWVIQPPDGVRLLSSRPSKTGEGGRGVVARYSDGTTASAMVNSDGSVRVLFFRGTEMLPAEVKRGVGAPRFTWSVGGCPTGL